MSDMAAWVRHEQEALWGDLDEALRFAANGYWSIASENVAQRLVGAIRLVGPTPYGDMPWSLLAGGVYAVIVDAAGVAPALALPSPEEWAHLEVLMRRHGGPRGTLETRYARTVASIKAADLEGDDDE